MAGTDAALFAWIRSLRFPGSLAVAIVLSGLAAPWTVAMLTAAGAAAFFAAGRPRDAWLLVATIACIALASHELKTYFSRARPLDPHDLESFPSGHAAMSVCFYATTAFLATRSGPPRRWATAAIAAAAAIAIAVGWSRIHLGAHWPSDVLAGYLLGFAGFAACTALAPDG